MVVIVFNFGCFISVKKLSLKCLAIATALNSTRCYLSSLLLLMSFCRFCFASAADEKVIRVFRAPKNFLENLSRLSRASVDVELKEMVRTLWLLWLMFLWVLSWRNWLITNPNHNCWPTTMHLNPLTPTAVIWIQLCQTRLIRVICNFWHPGTLTLSQGWASECPDVWHRMLYSCTHVVNP